MIALHRRILADTIRNQAFARALKAAIIPGKTTVVDIGSGTGFLAFLAAKLGAKHCYLIEEHAETLELSKKLAIENGITNCTFILGNSMAVELPEKVDLIVSETLGHFAYEENIIEIAGDARKRFLKPSGKMIPQSMELFVLPVINKRPHRMINAWDRVKLGLTFDAAKELSLSKMHFCVFRKGDLLPVTQARMWDAVDLSKDNESERSATVQWKFSKASHVYGFALWWKTVLWKGIELSTSHMAPPTHWGQVFIPLHVPLHVGRGETLEVALESDSWYRTGVHLRWDACVLNAKKQRVAAESMDTRHSHLVLV